jgi:hypothetical protein
MRKLLTWRRLMQVALVLSTFGWLASVQADDLNPAAIKIQLPKDIKWVDNPSGSSVAVLQGDPNKPGLYIVLNKWTPGHMSRPHYHLNDRFIYVISGTWWVGTGDKYDPASTKPVPAGSFVNHYKNELHYDGAKEGDAILYIIGQGPATSIPAGQKPDAARKE